MVRYKLQSQQQLETLMILGTPTASCPNNSDHTHMTGAQLTVDGGTDLC
jgi:hypothetical protein